MVTVQIRETTPELSGGNSDSDEYDDLELDILDQETDVGTADRQFVIVAPEVNDEEFSTQLVLFTPQVERDEPTIDVTPETDVQHGEWKSDIKDAKAAAVTQDEELGKIWMAAKAKKDAREAAGWPAAQTAQLQAILDQENAGVEMKENEIRRW
jgi:hypothetical protein